MITDYRIRIGSQFLAVWMYDESTPQLTRFEANAFRFTDEAVAIRMADRINHAKLGNNRAAVEPITTEQPVQAAQMGGRT